MFIDLLTKQKESALENKKQKDLKSLQDQLNKVKFTRQISIYIDGCPCGLRCGFVDEVIVEVSEESSLQEGSYVSLMKDKLKVEGIRYIKFIKSFNKREGKAIKERTNHF